MLAAAFSPDGSVLAIAAGDMVTMWNPWENVLLAVLHPPLENRGSQLSCLAFVPGTPFLVGWTQVAAAVNSFEFYATVLFL
jgi:NET1-associated nuclear protein 1 (U3 small nucleolar RNA-associated protein 17)